MAKYNTVSKRIGELSDSDVEVRRRAARKLGEKGDVRAVQPLCLALRDEDIYVRKAAVFALGNLHHPDALQPLRETLKEKREGLRGEAAWAIGQIGKHHAETTARAVELIVEAANRDKPREINRYVAALLAMGISAASPLCLEFSSHRSDKRQKCAMMTLKNLYYQQNLDVARHLLSDSLLTPAQVWNALEMLEAERPAGFLASRRYPTARRFCELAVSTPAEAPTVQQGAKRILDYLSLGRASQFSDPTASAQLLRMASDNTQQETGDTLLRGSTSNGQDGEARLQSPSFISRIADTWRSLLTKSRNWFE